MKSDKNLVRFRGITIEKESARLFRLAERELQKAVDSGNYNKVQDLLTEVKIHAGEEEKLQGLFEELRQETTDRWTKKHGPIKELQVVTDAIGDYCDARTKWYFVFAFETENPNEVSLEKAIASATDYADRLRPIAHASDSEFLPVFNELSNFAQDAWMEFFRAEERLASTLLQVCKD